MGDVSNKILAIDQSTSATKVILVNKLGGIEYRVTIPHKQYYPQQSFVEHDPLEIYDNTIAAIKQIINETKTNENNLAAIAITNQRETCVVWEKNTGLPIYNAAVWQCQRGLEYCETLREEGYNETIKKKTGLHIDPYFSASKLHWIMNHVEGAKQKARNGELLFGTMDSWLLWKLTDGRVHATDYSNACRTMLFNIHTLEWDEELISLFDLYPSMFPEVRFSDEVFGYTTPSAVFKQSVPIAGLMGDSHAALFGHNCFVQGMGKATYGTGSSIMLNIGEEPLDAPKGLVTSIGYGIGKKIFYVYEGNIHCTGDTINWLKNELGLINDPAETESLAISVKDNNGVYFVPAFVGLGAPYWDNSARASISGMSRNTTKAHIARAALESIAFQIKDIISLMEDPVNVKLQELRVDGGPTRNNFLMQFQADMLNKTVVRSEIEEISALGATFMAGLATGFWKDLGEIASLRKSSQAFRPSLENDKVTKLYDGWKKAIQRSRF